MTGLAKKLFNSISENPVQFRSCKTALHQWPFLEHLVEFYELNSIDLQIAKTLLKNYALEFESVAALICHLSNAVRSGHLMIKVENNEISPSVESIWTKDAKIDDEDLKKMNALCLTGFNELTRNEKLDSLISSNQNEFATTALCRFENMIYFQRYFNFETKVLENLIRLSKTEPSLKCDDEKVLTATNDLLKSQTLLKEQVEAVLKASKKSVTLICGGPGTGKTYTAGYLLKIIIASLQKEEKREIKIELAAPTGKAAANLQKSLSHLLTGTCKAKTLHQMLGLRTSGKVINNTPLALDADIILIDESSMIDVCMMGRLLSSIKSGTRIIFLGDKHQLPSVDAGAMFSDITKIYQENCVTLKTCLRAELQEIVDFGKAVNEGKSDLIFKMLESNVAVKKIEIDPINEQTLFETFKNRFPVIIKDSSSPVEILKSFDQFKMLSPLRKGSFGVDSLNRYFFDKLVKKSNQTIAVPIMLLRNDSRLELYNGEVGVLMLSPRNLDSAYNQVLKGDYALFPCKVNGYRKFPALILPQYEYAYCLSVHKSQGSEFDHLLCLLPDGSEHFGREVLYTAVTRARKTLMLFGNNTVIESTIKTQCERLSGLIRRNENETKNSCIAS